jgi:hypothetical protein
MHSIPTQEHRMGPQVVKEPSLGSRDILCFALEPAVVKCQNQRIVVWHHAFDICNFYWFHWHHPLYFLKAESQKTYSSAEGVGRSPPCLSLLLPNGCCVSRMVCPTTDQAIWYLAFRPFMKESWDSCVNSKYTLAFVFGICSCTLYTMLHHCIIDPGAAVKNLRRMVLVLV